MIARLTGRLVRRAPTRLLLDVGGVGYDVQIPLSTFYTLPAKADGTVSLEIHTHVRDDALLLFGFSSRVEKALFEKLIGVSGIGPRLACTVLSGLSAGEIVEAVNTEEPARLHGVPGVGRKTAQRIIVELKDRLDDLDGIDEVKGGAGATRRPSAKKGSGEDAVSALVNLGYRESMAKDAVVRASGRLGSSAGIEPLLREALRALVSGETG